jgi:5'-phosphate synthase pdxT subunit
MVVGLLGLQGAFLDHVRHLKTLNVCYSVVKDVDTLEAIDCLIIPGGESTVMEKFMTLFNMTNPLREKINCGLPVWGICAGCILLARTVDGRPGILGVLPVDLRRNAYGRQLESSKRAIDIPALGKSVFPALFIRAPRIEMVAPQVEVLAEFDEDPVCVRKDHILATTFHPELTTDSGFHEYFLNIVSKGRGRTLC